MGKTIQTIAIFAYVYETVRERTQPHLVVAPKSTISNWVKENQGYLFEITVPKNSIAQVVINKKPHQKITILKGETFFNKTKKANLNDWKFNLKGGEYAFRLSP